MVGNERKVMKNLGLFIIMLCGLLLLVGCVSSDVTMRRSNVGLAAGRPGTTAAVAGGMNILQELGPESMRAAANRTAKDIAKILRDAFQKQGWI